MKRLLLLLLLSGCVQAPQVEPLRLCIDSAPPSAPWLSPTIAGTPARWSIQGVQLVQLVGDDCEAEIRWVDERPWDDDAVLYSEAVLQLNLSLNGGAGSSTHYANIYRDGWARGAARSNLDHQVGHLLCVGHDDGVMRDTVPRGDWSHDDTITGATLLDALACRELGYVGPPGSIQ